jgi:hypothetical protein
MTIKDPIQTAMDAAKKASGQATGTASGQANAALGNVTGQATAALDNINGQLENLPDVKDVELLIKQNKAKAQKKITKVQEQLLTKKQLAVRILTMGLKSFALASIPSLKIPLIDPKILQGILIAKQLKKLLKDKRKITKKLLKENVEAFAYPIAPKIKLPAVPNIPALPTIPEIPEIPEINIPELPELPIVIPKLPQL